MDDRKTLIIKLEKLRKEFNGLVAVEGLNLEITEGEFLCFLGPSGCGKTTTLRMIAGLETPTSGEVHLRGVRITDLPPQERNVGFMFQNYALFWHMSVYDNLAFGLRVRRTPSSEIERKIHEIATNLELNKILETRASKLDLSAMQRVAMARTLAVDPDVLLLDEPLNNFRPGLREVMRGELKRWQRQLGRTMVYVTHDQEEAMTLGDRILVMKDGRTEQIDTPRKIFRHPANLFVADFIGRPPMNFLEMDYKTEGENAFLVRNELRLDVTPLRPRIEVVTEGVEFILGIRPQDMLLDGTREKKTLSNVFSAIVDLVQPMARKKILDLMVGEDKLKMVVAGTYQVSAGERVELAVDLERLHLFNRETTEAIF